MADKIEAHMALVTEYATACRNIPAVDTVKRAEDAWKAIEASARALAQGEPGEAETEVRQDGQTVRKDRWEIGIRRIVALLWGNRHEFEVDDVVEAVRALVPEPNEDDEGLVRAILSPTASAPAAPDEQNAQDFFRRNPRAALDAFLKYSECAPAAEREPLTPGVAKGFPKRILDTLKDMADRNPKGHRGPWEYGDGTSMQDDAEAAIAWIAAPSPTHIQPHDPVTIKGGPAE